MTTTSAPTDAPRRLTRARDDRIVGGVCGGIARYYDVDPVIPRIVLAVLAVFGGTGIAVYVFAWLLIPEDGNPSTRFERWLEHRGGNRGRDLLIVLAALFLLSCVVDTDPFSHRFSRVALLVVVVLVLAALFGRHRADRTTPHVPGAPGSPPGPVYYGPSPRPPSYGSAAWPETAPTAVWEPPAPGDRSWLPWLTLAATLIVGGGFGVAAAAGWGDPQPVDVLTACVAIVGTGVVVGTWFGRAWSMIPLGVVLVGCLVVANALPRDLTWSAGDRYWTPVSATTQPVYVLGAGDARLDLTALPAHQNVTVDSRVGAGRLQVFLPRNATVNLRASTSAGRIEVLGREQSGTGVDVNRQLVGTGAAPTVIDLTLDMGFGDVEIHRSGPTARGATR